MDIIIDCTEHEALRAYGPQIFARDIDLLSVSPGSLTASALAEERCTAAQQDGAKLYLVTGALDCVQAARVDAVHSVVYTGACR